MTSTHPTNNQTAVQLEYEPTVSSSTGDHFGPSENQNNCSNTDMIGGGGGTETQNEIIVPHNNSYSYQNSAQNSFQSYHNQRLEYRNASK